MVRLLPKLAVISITFIIGFGSRLLQCILTTLEKIFYLKLYQAFFRLGQFTRKC